MNARPSFACSDCPQWAPKLTGRRPMKFRTNIHSIGGYTRSVEVADGDIAGAQPADLMESNSEH